MSEWDKLFQIINDGQMTPKCRQLLTDACSQLIENVDVLSGKRDQLRIEQFPDQVESTKDCYIKKWLSNGLLHRSDAPALIQYYKDGTKKMYWYNMGQLSHSVIQTQTGGCG